MSVIYEMSSHSQMVMNNNEILNELVKQRWKLAFKKEMGTRYFTIRVEIEHLPREQSGGMDPLYGLLDIVAIPTSYLLIYVDGDKTPVRLVNKDEILSKWKICKKEILDTYGADENNLKMVENLEKSFEDYILEVRTSTFYHILLSQWKTKKKWNFTTGSTTCMGDSVEIEVKRSEKTQTKDGQISWQLQGEGEAQHIAKFKKQYDKQLKQYALADFDYRYKIRTEYTQGKGLPGIDLFDTATTHIEEQSSNGYKFYNTIKFKRVEE